MAFASEARRNESFDVLLSSASTATGTSAQILRSVTIPKNLLRRDGQSLRVTAWGTTGANGNSKTVELKFGVTGATSSLISSGALAANAKPFVLRATITRTSAGNQAYFADGQANAALVAASAGALTKDESAALALEFVATDGTSAAADVVLQGMIVEGLSD